MPRTLARRVIHDAGRATSKQLGHLAVEQRITVVVVVRVDDQLDVQLTQPLPGVRDAAETVCRRHTAPGCLTNTSHTMCTIHGTMNYTYAA